MRNIRCGARSTLAAIAFCNLLSVMVCSAQLSILPRFIFFENNRKSMPVTISNPTDAELEIWSAAALGYVTSDDTGRSIVVYDSTDATIPSATRWVTFYPVRFLLPPRESQIVRLTVTPPPGTPDGEYWARLIFASKPSVGKQRKGSTMTLIQRAGVPLHYRIGKVSTGLDVRDLKANSDAHQILLTASASRTGNASYWGSATARLLNHDGVVVSSSRRNLAIYRKYVVRMTVDRAKVPAGAYTIEVKFETAHHDQVADETVIQAAPIILRTDVTLQ